MCAAAHGWFYDWQTLIAGLLALLAGGGTVVGTLIASNHQVGTARRQTQDMRDMERRRIASEGYAFHAMLEAAMGLVIKDVEAARKIRTGGTTHSAEAYEARHRIRRTGFSELRAGCLRFGGTLTHPFLSLDEAIDDLAAPFIPNPGTYAGTQYLGANAGLGEQLGTIEQQAKTLRFEAEVGMKRCRDDLMKTPA
jgi:hypothetical protein